MNDIRLADTHDEPEILQICAMMHEEQDTYAISWERVVPVIRLATRHERGIIGVAGPRGSIRGAVCLLIEQPWFSDEYILLEYFNYVRPEHRKSKLARDQIAYSKSCADALNLDLNFAVLSNVRTEAKVRLYRRLLPCKGAIFVYSPPSKVARAPPANLIAAE